jgi:Tfp pilus assembly protein PilO
MAWQRRYHFQRYIFIDKEMTVRKKIYLTIFIFVIAVFTLVFLVVAPLFKGIRNHASDLLAAKEERAGLIGEIENLSEFKKQFQEYKANLEKIDSLLVDSEIPIEFIRFLEKLASDSGVSMEMYPLSAAESGNQDWDILGYQLSVSGPFLNFSRFLEKLENSSYLIEVQDMSLQKTAGDGTVKIQANFIIEVFAK